MLKVIKLIVSLYVNIFKIFNFRGFFYLNNFMFCFRCNVFSLYFKMVFFGVVIMLCFCVI